MRTTHFAYNSPHLSSGSLFGFTRPWEEMWDGMESSGPHDAPSHQPSLSGYFRSGIWPARKLPNYAWLPAMPLTSQRGPNWRAADLCPWTTGSHISSQNVRSCTSLTNLEWHRIFHIRPRFLKVTFCVPRPSCLSVDFLGLYIAPGWLINRHALCHRPCQSDRPFQPVPNLTYTQTFPKPHKRA